MVSAVDNNDVDQGEIKSGNEKFHENYQHLTFAET